MGPLCPNKLLSLTMYSKTLCSLLFSELLLLVFCPRRSPHTNTQLKFLQGNKIITLHRVSLQPFSSDKVKVMFLVTILLTPTGHNYMHHQRKDMVDVCNSVFPLVPYRKLSRRLEHHGDLRATWSLSACSDHNEPYCCSARMMTYLFQAAPCGFANSIADREPISEVRPHWCLLLGSLLDNLQWHNSRTGMRWFTYPLVGFSFRCCYITNNRTHPNHAVCQHYLQSPFLFPIEFTIEIFFI